MPCGPVGLGRGLGAENAMLDTGEIPNELPQYRRDPARRAWAPCRGGLPRVPAHAYPKLGSGDPVGAGHRSRGGPCPGTLAATLLIYGVTRSGVLESPLYWAFFAATAAITRNRPGDERVTRSSVVEGA